MIQVVESQPNPAYRQREPWNLQGHALWAWRALMLATLTWSLLAFSYIAVAVVAIWVATEVWLRRQRNRPRPGQGGGEFREDRQVGMEPDPLDASDSQGQ
jgi:hypothetical protein